MLQLVHALLVILVGEVVNIVIHLPVFTGIHSTKGNCDFAPKVVTYDLPC